MTIQIAAINTVTDSFGQWIEKTNQVLGALSDQIVTTNSNTAIGNSAIDGTAFTNGVFANAFVQIGNTTANAVLTNTKLTVYDTVSKNTSITSNGMIINGTTLYKSNIMQIGSTTIRSSNVTSNVGIFTDRIITGNTVVYPYLIQADAINTFSFTLQTLSIGDIEANVNYDRNGYTITANPTGDYLEQAIMTSTDLYIDNIHCKDLESSDTITANNIIINGQFLLGGSTGDIKFTSNVLFYGQKNFFAQGLTSNGNISIGIGLGKNFTAAVPLHVAKNINSGLQVYNAKSTAIFESGDNNLIEFRTPADSGKYAGMIFVDNNQGGYIVYNTPGGGVGGSYTDRFRIGAVSGINFEIGASNSTDGIAADRRIVLSATNSDIEISTTNGIKLYGTTSGSASIVAHPTATITKFTLPVNGGASGQALATNGTGGMYWRNVQAPIVPETDLRINSLGVACDPGASGTIRAAQDITAFIASDSSLKTNVKNIDNALDKIQSINGVEFDWTDEYIEEQGGEDGYFIRKHDVGVIAQEIESVLPEVVATRENGIKAVKYDRIVALLIEGIKELKAEVEELKKNTCKCGCAK